MKNHRALRRDIRRLTNDDPVSHLAAGVLLQAMLDIDAAGRIVNGGRMCGANFHDASAPRAVLDALKFFGGEDWRVWAKVAGLTEEAVQVLTRLHVRRPTEDEVEQLEEEAGIRLEDDSSLFPDGGD